MTDAGFPIIKYLPNQSARARGQSHGESFRQAIGELARIRRDLMIQKNPGLRPERIADLAARQWAATEQFEPEIADEVEGIAEGAKLSIEDLVVLNNYTDFRDIHVPDQGCSVIYVNRGEPLAGQTWDMHASAKNYVCCLEIPAPVPDERQIVFSLVGCVGLMGFNGRGLMVGVNNINTDGARPGVLWPVVIRHMLRSSTFDEMRRRLVAAPVTSGHSYLIANRRQAEFWEVMPDLAEKVSALASGDRGHLFHTNHCLGPRSRSREIVSAQSSTTHVRFGLLEKKLDRVQSFGDAYGLLNDHENYPQAICSNFQSGVQDPSVTCGGALGDLASGKITLWRGDELYDGNFVRHDLHLDIESRG
jgi:isopenicillin-N N-acyltransferase-like protein